LPCESTSKGPKLALGRVDLDALVGEHHLRVALDLVGMKGRLAFSMMPSPKSTLPVRTPDDREERAFTGDHLATEASARSTGRDETCRVRRGVLDHPGLELVAAMCFVRK
jgi:hypothetical protein